MTDLRRGTGPGRALAICLALAAAMPAWAGCDRVDAALPEGAPLDEVKDWVRAEGAGRVDGTPEGTYEYFDEGVAFWVALKRYPDGRICGRYGRRYFEPERTFTSHVVLGGQLSNGAWEVELAEKAGTAKTGYGAMLLFDMEDLVLADGAVLYAGGKRFALMRPISPLEGGESRAGGGVD